MENKQTNDYLHHLPVKPIKRILKKFYEGEISDETCVYVRDLLLQFTELLAEEAVKEFQNNNIERLNRGLPQLKRLHKSSFIDIWDRFFKSLNVPNMGEVGKQNETLLCPKDGAKKDV